MIFFYIFLNLLALFGLWIQASCQETEAIEEKLPTSGIFSFQCLSRTQVLGSDKLNCPQTTWS